MLARAAPTAVGAKIDPGVEPGRAALDVDRDRCFELAHANGPERHAVLVGPIGVGGQRMHPVRFRVPGCPQHGANRHMRGPTLGKRGRVRQRRIAKVGRQQAAVLKQFEGRATGQRMITAVRGPGQPAAGSFAVRIRSVRYLAHVSWLHQLSLVIGCNER